MTSDPVPPGDRPRRRWTGWLVGAAVLVACYVSGLVVVNLQGTSLSVWVERLFPRIGQGDALSESSIQAAWATVQREYVLRSITGTLGTQGAEQGIINALKSRYNDRFSNFFTAADYRSLQQDLSGERAGSIGIALEPRCAGAVTCPSGQSPTLLAIEQVLHGQPAERAGLRNGDVLIEIGGNAVSGLASDITTQLDRAAARIRGQAGTTVTLTVQRGTQRLTVTVTRADLHIPSVYSQRIGSTLYLQVTGFDEGTGDDARRALTAGLGSGVSSVVLDLRGNPGGLVTEAQSLASQFLKPTSQYGGAVVVRRGRLDAAGDPKSAQKVEVDSIQSGGVALTPKLEVLVDGDTASAAEIVSAALHDYHRATLIGQKTFGKGSVQEDFPLPDGSDLHLTVEKWFGPAGESIDGTGITPDRIVPSPDEDHRFRLDAQSADPSQDPQLQTALTALGATAPGP